MRTTSAWSRTPAARALLARITPADLYVRLEYAFAGSPDRLVLTFDGKEALEKARADFVERCVGMTFGAAEVAGRAQDYLAADACHTSVDDVLAGMFGDPNQWRGWGVAGAQEAVRAALIHNERAVA